MKIIWKLLLQRQLKVSKKSVKSAYNHANLTGRGIRDKKQMQFFVPSFLVASQVGWWLLALAGVTLLSIKAFLVSKLALVIAAVMTFKKALEHHHG